MTKLSQTTLALLQDSTNSKLIAHVDGLRTVASNIVTLNFSPAAQAELANLYPNASIQHSNVNHLMESHFTIAEESTDLIIANFVNIDHPMLKQILPDIRQILKPTGLFIFATLDKINKLSLDTKTLSEKDTLSDLHNIKLILFSTINEHLAIIDKINTFIDCKIYFSAKTEIPELTEIKSRYNEYLATLEEPDSIEIPIIEAQDDSESKHDEEEEADNETEEEAELAEPSEIETTETEALGEAVEIPEHNSEIEKMETSEKSKTESENAETEASDSPEKPEAESSVEIELKEETQEVPEKSETETIEKQEKESNSEISEIEEPKEKSEIESREESEAELEKSETESTEPPEIESNLEPSEEPEEKTELDSEEEPETELEKSETEPTEPPEIESDSEPSEEPEEKAEIESEEETEVESEKDESETTESIEKESKDLDTFNETELSETEPTEENVKTEPDVIETEKTEPIEEVSTSKTDKNNRKAPTKGLNTLMQHLEESKKKLEDHRIKISEHLNSSALMMKELMNAKVENKNEQHKEMLNTYRSLYSEHQDLLNTLFNTHQVVIAANPKLADKYHELIEHHKQILAEHKDQIEEHDKFLNPEP